MKIGASVLKALDTFLRLLRLGAQLMVDLLPLADNVVEAINFLQGHAAEVCVREFVVDIQQGSEDVPNVEIVFSIDTLGVEEEVSMRSQVRVAKIKLRELEDVKIIQKVPIPITDVISPVR